MIKVIIFVLYICIMYFLGSISKSQKRLHRKVQSGYREESKIHYSWLYRHSPFQLGKWVIFHTFILKKYSYINIIDLNWSNFNNH